MQETQSLDLIELFPCRGPVYKEGMIYGYARVSTDGQTVAAQVATLTAAGATKVFRQRSAGRRPTARSFVVRAANLRRGTCCW